MEGLRLPCAAVCAWQSQPCPIPFVRAGTQGIMRAVPPAFPLLLIVAGDAGASERGHCSCTRRRCLPARARSGARKPELACGTVKSVLMISRIHSLLSGAVPQPAVNECDDRKDGTWKRLCGEQNWRRSAVPATGAFSF